MCDSAAVTRSFTIRRLLAIVMIAGLVLAPLTRPVLAGPVFDAAMPALAEHGADITMTDHHAASDDAELTSDMAAMPCCPSTAPAPADCDKCPLMAGCASIVSGMPTAAALPLRFATNSVAALVNDFWPDGLGHAPPDQPPRLLV